MCLFYALLIHCVFEWHNMTCHNSCVIFTLGEVASMDQSSHPDGVWCCWLTHLKCHRSHKYTRLSWRCWLLNPSCMHNPGILSACTVFSFVGHFFWCYQGILFYLHLLFLLTLQKLMSWGSVLSFSTPHALCDSMAEPEFAHILLVYTHISRPDHWITWKLSQVILLQPQCLKDI